jgi:hypothetical protein
MPSASFSAHYTKNREVFDVRDFPRYHSAALSPKKDLLGSFLDWKNIRLSDGSFVFAAQQFDESAESRDPVSLALQRLTADGETEGEPLSLPLGFFGHNDFWRTHMAPLSGGGFVVASTLDDRNGQFRIFSNDLSHGDPVDFPFFDLGEEAPSQRTGTNYLSPGVTGLGDGGFVTFVSDDWASLGSEVRRFDAIGAQVGAAYRIDGGISSLSEISGGRLLAVGREGREVSSSGKILALVLGWDADSNSFVEEKRQEIFKGYINEAVCVAQNVDGNILVAFEDRGPDALAYAVLDSEGDLVVGPNYLVSAEIGSNVDCAVLEDQSFAVVAVEEDSYMGMMFNISRSGSPDYHQDVLGVMPYWDQWPSEVYSNPDNTLTMIFRGYGDQPGVFRKFSKNRLDLIVESSTEVRVVNNTAHTVTVTITAHEPLEAE